jgi:hypothetical protein
MREDESPHSWAQTINSLMAWAFSEETSRLFGSLHRKSEHSEPLVSRPVSNQKPGA